MKFVVVEIENLQDMCII